MFLYQFQFRYIWDGQSSCYPCAEHCRWGSCSTHGHQSASSRHSDGPLEPYHYWVKIDTARKICHCHVHWWVAYMLIDTWLYCTFQNHRWEWPMSRPHHRTWFHCGDVQITFWVWTVLGKFGPDQLLPICRGEWKISEKIPLENISVYRTPITYWNIFHLDCLHNNRPGPEVSCAVTSQQIHIQCLQV